MTQFPTLTCVKCGYSLHGLAHNASCPECGTSIQSSVEGFHRQAAQSLNPIKWLKRIAGFAIIRDIVWIAAALFIGGSVEGFLICAIPFTVIAEINVHIFLFLAQPKLSPNLPWYHPSQGFFWCTAAILLGPLLIPISCGLGYAGLHDQILFPIIGAGFITYLTLRTAAWICAMRFGRFESHHPEHPRGLPLWDMAIKLSCLVPIVALGGLMLFALEIAKSQMIIASLAGVSLLGSIATYCAAHTLLNYRRPG